MQNRWNIRSYDSRDPKLSFKFQNLDISKVLSCLVPKHDRRCWPSEMFRSAISKILETAEFRIKMHATTNARAVQKHQMSMSDKLVNLYLATCFLLNLLFSPNASPEEIASHHIFSTSRLANIITGRDASCDELVAPSAWRKGVRENASHNTFEIKLEILKTKKRWTTNLQLSNNRNNQRGIRTQQCWNSRNWFKCGFDILNIRIFCIEAQSERDVHRKENGTIEQLW